MKKAVSGIVLMLLLTSALSSAFFIQPVESDYVWSETIYIRADGSVEPLGAPITTADNMTYTLTDNIGGSVPETGTAIIIQRNNIILDGAGYTLQDLGTGFQTKGIILSGRTNVTIKSIRIKNFSAGIQVLSNSNNNSIFENTITNCSWGGIYLGSSSGNSINGNNVTDNFTGIALGDSPNNSIGENTVANCSHYGIDLYLSPGSSVSGNNMTANGVRALRLASSSNCSVNGNIMAATSNGYGIEVTGSSNCSISGNTITANKMAGINLGGSSNNSISSNTITANSGAGVSLGNNNNNNSISGNTITANSGAGVSLGGSSNKNSISGNNIAANIQEGITLYGACNNSLIGNNVANNNYGVRLESLSNYNSISENTITANSKTGIELWIGPSGNNISSNTITANNERGIYLVQSQNNSLSGNTIANNSYGVELWWSPDNSITGNDITANSEAGIKLSYSSNNVVYHNNFIGNAQQAQIPTPGYASIWDDGYPSGGNYWSDYAGIDEKSGPSQDEPGSDEIGDTPYIIDPDNRDRYPLMAPYGTIAYRLTIATTSGGTTTPSPGTYTYVNGTEVEVTATSDTGFSFDYWLLDSDIRTENPITIIIDSNYTLTAHFIDDIPPITTITLDGDEGAGGWFVSTVAVTLSATDVSGVDKTEYSFDNSTWTLYTTPFTVTNEGNIIVYYKSTDNVGNVETTKTETLKIDKTAPSGSVIINNGATYTNSTSVTLTLTAADTTSGVNQIRLSNDGVWDTKPWETSSSTKAWTLATGDGSKTVYYKVRDNAGLVSATYSATITLGTPPPPPPAEAFPTMWIAALAVAAIAILILAAVFLRRKRKKR